MNVTPLQDWVVVKMVPLKEEVRNGVIILKDTTAQTVMVGTIVKIGPGRFAKGTNKRIPLGVEVGEKVAFFRWNNEHQQGKTLRKHLAEFGDDFALLRVSDILFVYTGELEIG